MNIQSWNILLVLALLIVLSGGGFILYQDYQQKQAELSRFQAEEQARIEQEKERKAQEQIALMQRFEDFINTFLQDIHAQALEYKKARTVMEELIAPANLATPQYIADNARLAENTVMSLQMQMDDIMNRFKIADENIGNLIADLETENQTRVAAVWDEMRNENTEKLMILFTTDQAVLIAELKLIEFYNEHADDVQMNSVRQHILFDDVTLQEQQALLKANIIQAKAAQKDALKGGP